MTLPTYLEVSNYVVFCLFSFIDDPHDPRSVVHGGVFFILDAALPFFEVINRQGKTICSELSSCGVSNVLIKLSICKLGFLPQSKFLFSFEPSSLLVQSRFFVLHVTKLELWQVHFKINKVYFFKCTVHFVL